MFSSVNFTPLAHGNDTVDVVLQYIYTRINGALMLNRLHYSHYSRDNKNQDVHLGNNNIVKHSVLWEYIWAYRHG